MLLKHVSSGIFLGEKKPEPEGSGCPVGVCPDKNRNFKTDYLSDPA
jgi:hypothetical protein